MSALTVFKFSTPNGAQQAIGVLESAHEQGLLFIDDYSIVSWPEGAKKPNTFQATTPIGKRALEGTFWGLLFGLIFFVPLLGVAVGATIGAMSGVFADVGIDKKFIESVKSKVTPGTSALFLLSDDAVIDPLVVAFRELPSHELIATNLSTEQEAKLRETFA